MSIESFGAVVSDNDGSAFITKAEFDSLKNNFQNQIDQYNTSIDSKIDGAIASYLAGIKSQKTTTKQVLVSNYNQMRWINEFKVYGKYKHWTSLNNYIEQPEGWFVPHAAEQRMNMRSDWIKVVDTLNLGTGNASLCLSIEPTGSAYGTTWQRAAYVGANGYPQTPPVLCLELKKIGGIWCIDNDIKWINQYCMAYIAEGKPVRGTKITGTNSDWWFSTSPLWMAKDVDPIKIESADPSKGEILKYKVWLGSNQNAASTNLAETSQFEYVKTIDNMHFPISYAEGDPFGGQGYGSTTTAQVQGTGYHFGVDDTLTTGVTFHYFINRAQQNLWKYMMYGVDDDFETNLCLSLGNAGEGRIFDFTESSSFGLLDGYIREMNIDNFLKSRPNNSSYYQYKGGLGIWIRLRIPNWPIAKLRNIPNANFEFNGNYLKVGQGLPLVADIDDSGYLQITFGYDVKYILDEQSKNKQILISIKKEDFNTDNNKYCSGYLDLVDPATTTQTIYTLNNKTFENIDGKVKLTVPVEKGDNLWLRIAPQNSNGGYYAVLDNLKITYISE